MLKNALQNLIHHWSISLPSIVITAIVLTMGMSLLSVNNEANKILEKIGEKLFLTVYLKDDADPFAVGNLITVLEKRSDVVAPVKYTSKEEAWKSVENSFAIDTSLLEKYKFSLPASLTITPRKPSDTAAIQRFLRDAGQNLLAEASLSEERQENISSRMAAFINSVEKATGDVLIFLVVLFIGGGSLLVSAAIHLAIAGRHKEISIMKLVGAKRNAIAMPFIIEGALMNFLAFLLHVILLFLLPLDSEFTSSKLFMNALLFEGTAAIILGGLAAAATTSFHLKKKHLFA